MVFVETHPLSRRWKYCPWNEERISGRIKCRNLQEIPLDYLSGKQHHLMEGLYSQLPSARQDCNKDHHGWLTFSIESRRSPECIGNLFHAVHVLIDHSASSRKMDKFVNRQSPSSLDRYRYQGGSKAQKITQQKWPKQSRKSLDSVKHVKRPPSFSPTWTPIDKRARQVCCNGNM